MSDDYIADFEITVPKLTKFKKEGLFRILYHGTKGKNVKSILKDGFKEYTYFAKDLKSAIYMGGSYVFSVIFHYSMNPKWFDDCMCWQFLCGDPVPPQRIITIRKYDYKELYENTRLCDMVHQNNIAVYISEGY